MLSHLVRNRLLKKRSFYSQVSLIGVDGSSTNLLGLWGEYGRDNIDKICTEVEGKEPQEVSNLLHMLFMLQERECPVKTCHIH